MSIDKRSNSKISNEDKSMIYIDESRIDRYQILGLLETGGFSSVWKAVDTQTNEEVALQIISKIKMKRKIPIFLKTLRIMTAIDSPYITKLKERMFDSKKLYVIWDYIKGGELKAERFLRMDLDEREKAVKFVGAQMVLILKKLRQFGIVHRDIKPENILITEKGYIKIIDFNLSVPSHNIVLWSGTPEYLAPEILMKTYQNHAVDLWCTGALLYELFTGYCVLDKSDSKKEIKTMSMYKIDLDKIYDDHLRDFIGSLLVFNPKDRLGYYSVEELKKHEMFEGMNWELLESQTVVNPYNLYTREISFEKKTNNSIMIYKKDTFYTTHDDTLIDENFRRINANKHHSY